MPLFLPVFLTLLQNCFFSILLWERKKIWQFPLLFPWHTLCARKLAQRSWYCPLLGRCRVCTPRSCLVWPFWWNPHGTVLTSCCPGSKHSPPGCCTPFLSVAAVFHLYSLPGSTWSFPVCSGFCSELVNTIKWSCYGTSWQHKKLSHCLVVLFTQQFVPRT